MAPYAKAENHVIRTLLGKAYRCCADGEPVPVDLYCDLSEYGIDAEELTCESITSLLKERNNG